MQAKPRFVFQTLFFVGLAIAARNSFAETMPTLRFIAQANEAAWAAVESVDMEFAVINETVIDDEEFLTASFQNRWIYTPVRERLTRVYDLGDAASMMSDSLLDDTALRERQVTHDEDGDLTCGTILPAINPIWQSRVNLSPYMLRYPCGEIDLDTTKTLRWIIEHWPTTLHGPHLSAEDTIWLLHVQCPVEQPWLGGMMQIEVNAHKDYLVQKVTINGLDMGFSDDGERTTIVMQIDEFVRSTDDQRYFPSGFAARQFSEPRTETSRPHTVYKEIPTRLAVNGPLPDHCFEFKFEKYEIVTEYNSLSEITAIYLWGNDVRPMETFASYEELDRWQFRRDISAFLTDYFNLSHIIGRDLGLLTRDTMMIGRHYLLAERRHKQVQLRALATLPIDNANQQPPQVVETAVATE